MRVIAFLAGLLFRLSPTLPETLPGGLEDLTSTAAAPWR
jgi:hypothetical protein